MTQAEYQMEESIKHWNILAVLLFAILTVVGYFCLTQSDQLFYAISLGDFLILGLAILRVIRLVAYDNITLFLREAFLDVKRVRYADGGEEFVERVLSENSFKRTVYKLLNCPWCIGVWIALGVLYLYFAYPITWFLFLLLALASVGSLLQIFSNWLGWNAEYKKIQATKLEQKN